MFRRSEKHTIGWIFGRLLPSLLALLLLSMPLFALTKGQHPFDYRVDNEAGEPDFSNSGTLVLMQPLPAVLSYVPEPVTYFKKCDVTAVSNMRNKAIAKLGTLTFEAIVNGYHSVDGAYTDEQLAKMVGNPKYITELYMNSNSYWTYNQLPNESDLTFFDADGNPKMMHVQLVAVCFYKSGKKFMNLSFSGGGWNTSTNPNLVNGGQFYPGDYVDFYLMTTENWDENLRLDSVNKAEIDANFRDITKWSYRFANGNNDRYETKGMGIAGYGPMNNDVVHNGFSYNVPPDIKMSEVWSFSMNPMPLAQNLDATTDIPQKIANATLTPVDYFGDISFSVIYSFKSLGNADGRFYLKSDSLPGIRVPYELAFSPHGSESLEAGKDYIWHVGSLIDGAGELFVKNLAATTKSALATTWYDTIQITITSTDNEYTSST